MTRIDYVTCVVTVTEGGIAGGEIKSRFFSLRIRSVRFSTDGHLDFFQIRTIIIGNEEKCD